jgi:hypothetical protein
MSLTPKAQRQVIEDLFEFWQPGHCLEIADKIGSNHQDVVDFLEAVEEFLLKLHPGERNGVPMGRGATTADLAALALKRSDVPDYEETVEEEAERLTDA